MKMRMVATLSLSLVAAAANGNDFQDHAQAAARLTDLAAQGKRAHRTPRLTDKDAGPLLSLLSDRQRFLRDDLFTFANRDKAFAMCLAVGRVAKEYMMADVDLTNFDPARDGERVGLQLRDNLVRYQDELIPLQVFYFACVGRQIPLLEQTLASLAPGDFDDVRRDGLRQMRQGLFGAYAPLMRDPAEDAGVSPANQFKIMRVMAEVAPVYAAAMPVSERHQIAAMAREILPSMPAPLKADVERIAVAMSVSTCTGLCAL